jgi:aspartyl-tRNA(Asn)/glutamyl-tRNA(Gln) amidotransferase subunit B
MRTKEDAADYRYMPEPDLPPLNISDELIEQIRINIPMLPNERRRIYQEKYGIPEDDAKRLTKEPATARCFERTADLTPFAQIAANLLISSVSDTSSLDSEFPKKLALLCDAYGNKKINSSLLKELLEKVISSGIDPRSEIESRELMQISSEDTLLPIIKTVILENEKAVKDYLGGKEAAAKSLVGRIMRATSGRADPLLAAQLLQVELERLKNV